MLTSIQFRSSGRFPGSSLKFTVTRERRIVISATSSSPFRCLDESNVRPTIGVRSSEQESSTDTKKEWLFLLLCVGLALPLPHSSSIFRAPLRSFFIISHAIHACHCCCSICISCAVLTHTRSSPFLKPPHTYACMFHRSVSVERFLRFFRYLGIQQMRIAPSERKM